MKSVLANIGFVMQISGIFIILPIIISFAYNETDATIGLFIAATSFSIFGFLLNALCERKELSFKQSATIIVLVFIILSFIGSIPYLYINITNSDVIGNITDSVFESASGFTTTGFSFIRNTSAVPRSIIFYRALTQFIGGIGIVLVLLAFFYPEEKLKEFSKSIGFHGTNHRIKNTFLLILLIYAIYCVFIVVISFLSGYHDILNLIAFSFAAISTGGFSPVNDIGPLVQNTFFGLMLMVGMVLGASNFLIMAGLLKRRFKQFMRSEVFVYMIMIIVAVSIVTIAFGMPLFDAAFHTISAMTNAGFMYLKIVEFPTSLKFLLTILIFIGGTSFSTAGGIKIWRFLLLFKAAKNTVNESITHQTRSVVLFDKIYSKQEIMQCLITIILMATTVIIASLIIVSYGYSLSDTVFEVSSAIANTGLTTGVASVSLAAELKWVFIAVMILGRVEVYSFFLMISRAKEPIQQQPPQVFH